MKKVTLAFIALFFVLGITAQEVKDTTYWKRNGDFTLNFSQVSFSNWAAGGKNSVSGVALYNYAANYLKDRMSWDNSLNLGYGLLKEGSNELIKSEDKMEFNSKAGYRMAPESKWFYSGLLGLQVPVCQRIQIHSQPTRHQDFGPVCTGLPEPCTRCRLQAQ